MVAHTMSLDFNDLSPRGSDGSHLSDRQVRQIERYMALLLDRLNLGHWRVQVAQDLPPEDALLMIEPVDGRRIATLYVAADWWERHSPAEKRIDLTHEALHLAHHDLDEHVRRFINGSGDISDYVKTLFIEQFKVNAERMVDALSYAVAELAPPWDTGKAPKRKAKP